MFFSKRLFAIIFAIFGFVSALAVDLTDLLKQRDELIAQRSSMDSQHYFESLRSILVASVERYQYEQAMARVSDVTHFANFGQNSISFVIEEIQNSKKTNSAYFNFNLDQMLICDLSRLDRDIVNAVLKVAPFPAGIISKEKFQLLYNNKNSDEGMLKAGHKILEFWQTFPNTRYMLFFNPYCFPSAGSLSAILKHELAHLTQLWEASVDTRRWMEIDADIKAILVRNVDGKWHLSSNYAQLTNDLYNAVQWLCESENNAIEALCLGLEGNELCQTFNDLKDLWFINCHSIHPIAEHRRGIMQAFAKIMTQIGCALTDDELTALTLFMTKNHYKNYAMSNNFLLKVTRAEKKLRENPTFRALLSTPIQ